MQLRKTWNTQIPAYTNLWYINNNKTENINKHNHPKHSEKHTTGSCAHTHTHTMPIKNTHTYACTHACMCTHSCTHTLQNKASFYMNLWGMHTPKSVHIASYIHSRCMRNSIILTQFKTCTAHSVWHTITQSFWHTSSSVRPTLSYTHIKIH